MGLKPVGNGGQKRSSLTRFPHCGTVYEALRVYRRESTHGSPPNDPTKLSSLALSLHNRSCRRRNVRSIIAAHPIPRRRGTRRTQDRSLCGLISILSGRVQQSWVRPTPRRRSTSYRNGIPRMCIFALCIFILKKKRRKIFARGRRAQEVLKGDSFVVGHHL